MFENQPKGLYALALANTGERFGYYTMLAIFALFMQAKFGWTESQAGQVYAIFLAVVYFAPLLGGILADKIGYGKCVTIGFATMFFGYLGLAIPTGANDIGKAAMFAGLACVSLGTGLFKGNLQVLVGNLYDNPKYSSSRDSAFSLFYMAINIGAMFAPSMAKWITNIYLRQYGFVYDAGNFDPAYLHTLYGAYGLCFGVACISLILSAIIYFACRSWFKHADERSYRCLIIGLRCCDILLDGFPSERFCTDFLRKEIYRPDRYRLNAHLVQHLQSCFNSTFSLHRFLRFPGKNHEEQGHLQRCHIACMGRCTISL